MKTDGRRSFHSLRGGFHSFCGWIVPIVWMVGKSKGRESQYIIQNDEVWKRSKEKSPLLFLQKKSHLRTHRIQIVFYYYFYIPVHNRKKRIIFHNCTESDPEFFVSFILVILLLLSRLNFHHFKYYLIFQHNLFIFNFSKRKTHDYERFL